VRTGALHLRSYPETGYAPSDEKIFVYADTILQLNPASLTSLLKVVFGLSAYLLRLALSGNNGLEIWRARVSYHYKLLRTRRRCRVPLCEAVLGYRYNKEIVDGCVRHIF